MMFQRSMTTAVPTVRNMKSPTILQLIVRAKNTPVMMSHVHHCWVNSLLHIKKSQLLRDAIDCGGTLTDIVACGT